MAVTIDTSKPDSSVGDLLCPQSSIVTVGLFDDILQEAGVWFRRIGSWSAAVFISLLQLPSLWKSELTSWEGSPGVRSWST